MAESGWPWNKGGSFIPQYHSKPELPRHHYSRDFYHASIGGKVTGDDDEEEGRLAKRLQKLPESRLQKCLERLAKPMAAQESRSVRIWNAFWLQNLAHHFKLCLRGT
jgi:hypothetical protein